MTRWLLRTPPICGTAVEYGESCDAKLLPSPLDAPGGRRSELQVLVNWKSGDKSSPTRLLLSTVLPVGLTRIA